MVWTLTRSIEGVLLAGAGLVLIGALVLWASPYRLARIQTGSMQPIFGRGDAVLIDTAPRPARIGEVIAYRSTYGSTITHRVTAILPKQRLVTEGDALNVSDSPISAAQVLGRVTLIVTGAGMVLDIVHTPVGYGLLILLPCALVLYVEVWALIRHARATSYQAQPNY